jgi:hypothetical protein
MTNTVKVRVQWSDWKLNHLPPSGIYTTAAKFPEDEATWPKEGWSVVLQFDPQGVYGSGAATARFLSPDGPYERFKPGCEFEMCEGNRVSAKVTVLAARTSELWGPSDPHNSHLKQGRPSQRS